MRARPNFSSCQLPAVRRQHVDALSQAAEETVAILLHMVHSGPFRKSPLAARDSLGRGLRCISSTLVGSIRSRRGRRLGPLLVRRHARRLRGRLPSFRHTGPRFRTKCPLGPQQAPRPTGPDLLRLCRPLLGRSVPHPKHQVVRAILQWNGQAVALFRGLAPKGVILGRAPPSLEHHLHVRKGMAEHRRELLHRHRVGHHLDQP